jgi:hypothetical protein
MPLNDKKIISLILDQCKGIEERCKGYRGEITDLVTDILSYERQHRTHGINIQQKISDKCKAAGQLLTERRNAAGAQSRSTK